MVAHERGEGPKSRIQVVAARFQLENSRWAGFGGRWDPTGVGDVKFDVEGVCNVVAREEG